MQVGDAHDGESGVIITLKDVYDAQMANGGRLITLEAAVRAADTSSRQEWKGIARTLADHERRLRTMERLQWALPLGVVSIVIAEVVRVVIR